MSHLRDLGPAFLAAGMFSIAGIFGWMAPLERPVSDFLLRVPRLGAPEEAPFVVVSIDDPSLRQYGPLPWPRERIANLIRICRGGGARAIVLDMLFPEPAGGDLELGEAISEGPSILAAARNPDERWILPSPALGGVRLAAHSEALIEGDGIVRSIPARLQAGQLPLEALSVRAARLAGWEGATAPEEIIRPFFRPAPEQIPSFSALRVLDGDIPAGSFEDRVVFIGVSATGASDSYLVPVARHHALQPGVLVHASIAASILDGGLLHRASPASSFLLFLLFGVLLMLLRSRAGRLRLQDPLLLVFLAFLFALAALWTNQVLIPLGGLFGALLLSLALREGFESRQAQVETGNILKTLLEEENPGIRAPRSAGGRLRLARRLQQNLIVDRNVRRTLLEGLEEGVILWDREGRPLSSNAAFSRLWASMPGYGEIAALGKGTAESDLIHLRRRGRFLELRLRFLPGGMKMGLLRDISARIKLEQHRKETQRMLSHELKTPLASLAGFGSMLEKYPMSESELRETGGMIRNEAERLGEMVRSFLDLERLAGNLPDEEELSLGDILQSRCSLLRAAAQAKEISLDCRKDGDAGIRGRKELLIRLIDNLIGNAIKYSPPGAEIEARCREEGSGVILEISDTGPGIPPEHLEKIFERFYRVPGESEAGSGLGLAMVREIAELHGAEISAESTLGEGSRFVVHFRGTGRIQ